jgi:hypothetical protein
MFRCFASTDKKIEKSKTFVIQCFARERLMLRFCRSSPKIFPRWARANIKSVEKLNFTQNDVLLSFGSGRARATHKKSLVFFLVDFLEEKKTRRKILSNTFWKEKAHESTVTQESRREIFRFFSAV